ncbi:XrtA system polysaccharide deacetylase [Photobacterium arenosum]|uniref:XrtA system polysaccharide deacetylase n=1 Tax=Photobacterium arenosum TaxID=2774143 RepID=UPI00288A3EE5|nr:XrtA system polysaccharide deacetylase [Photobacterium arenosum]
MKETHSPVLRSFVNAMTVDVEDYFHVSAFSSIIKQEQWGKSYPLRVDYNTRKIMDIFAEHDVKATFFILGWVADACPSLIKTIADQGHELACHGYHHVKANQQTEKEFFQDVSRSKFLIEDLSGKYINGYRAPSFSIDDTNLWAFDILHRLGFTFSSSTYPVRHDHYGNPDWPRFLHQRNEGLVEIPIPTYQAFGTNLPIGGGGYFRLYPYAISKHLIRRFTEQYQQPFCFYFHPWEIDAQQPRMTQASFKSRFRHYLNLEQMTTRLHHLLQDFQWSTVSQAYQLNGHDDETGIDDPQAEPERLHSLGPLR